MDGIGGLARDDSARFTNNPQKKTVELDDSYEIIETGNCYIEQLLESLLENAETGFDPYYPEDYILTTPFVKAHLYNGRVIGLRSVHRAGKCFLTKTHRRLHILADIGASDVDIVFDVALQWKCFNLKFTLNIHFRHIQIETNFSIFTNSGRGDDFYYFQIEKMRGVVPKIAICKPLDWLLNMVIWATVWFMNTPFKRLLSDKIKREIQGKVSTFQFPVVIDRNSPTFDEFSETTRNPPDNGLSSQEGNESLTDGRIQGNAEKSSESGFLSPLDKFRRIKSRCEKIGDEITPELAFQLALEEFQRPKPSYEIF